MFTDTVDAGHRFVEQNDRAVVGECPGQDDPLALPAREGSKGAVGVLTHPDRVEGALRGGVVELPPIKLGARVAHASFGEGVVTHFEGAGSSARVQVNFANGGAKWLVLAFANLTVL